MCFDDKWGDSRERENIVRQQYGVAPVGQPGGFRYPLGGDQNAPDQAPGQQNDNMSGSSSMDAMLGFGTNDLFNSQNNPAYSAPQSNVPGLPGASAATPPAQSVADYNAELSMRGIDPEVAHDSRLNSKEVGPAFNDQSAQAMSMAEAGHPNVNAPAFSGRGGGGSGGGGGKSGHGGMGVGEGPGGPGTGGGHGMGGSAESTGTGGWKEGGFTGSDGDELMDEEVEGPVHEDEFVFDRPTTDLIGLDFLEQMLEIGKGKGTDAQKTAKMKALFSTWGK